MDTSIVRGGARARARRVSEIGCVALGLVACGCAPDAKPVAASGDVRETASEGVAPRPLSAPAPTMQPAPTLEVQAPASVPAPARYAPVAPVPPARPSLYRVPRVRSEARQAASSRKMRSPSVTAGVGRGSADLLLNGYRSGGMALAGGPLAAPHQQEFDTEAYAHVAEQGFVRVLDSPLSTFSVDVDTASYSNVRRMLREGRLPPPDAVRIEEMINYFRYDYPAPRGADPVAVHTEIAAAPWARSHRLVQIGLRARELPRDTEAPRNLVFLVDVSGSMQSPDKLALLKQGLALLARDLEAKDRIAIVVYAGASGLALPSTRGSERATILATLGSLEAGGSTNGADGIQLAYRVARQHFIRGGINRVILATDGDFNVGVTSHGELTRLIERERKSGVFLTVLGFGTGNLKDSTMEALADHGNGNYAYVDSLDEAHKVLVREAGATLVTVAKDVKLQIEWNPRRVASYRLIGYENRRLADRDFNDDAKDAGEMGAGHTVTALYDVVLAGDAGGRPEVDELRYQAQRAPSVPAGSDELLTVKLRYKAPDSELSEVLTHPVRDVALAAASALPRELSLAAAVAGFGMLLRGSEHKGSLTLAQARELALHAIEARPSKERGELIELMDQARRLGVL
jgi:Ca-activated chloride channel family protein